MIALLRNSLVVAFALSVASVVLGCRAAMAADDAKPAASQSQSLTPHDRQLLDKLMTQFIFDPQGAECVIVAVKRPGARQPDDEWWRLGWRVAGKPGQPERVYFDDGENIPLAADAKTEKVDFVAACRQRYAKKPAKGRDGRATDNKPTEESRVATAFGSQDLVVAAWLHRLGQEALAVEALERAAEQPVNEFGSRGRYANQPEKRAGDAESNMIAAAKNRLATRAYWAMVHAFTSREDDEALAAGERLMKLYPDESKKLNQAVAVYDDLKRRQKKGTLGKKPPDKLPDGFASWDIGKKYAYLIDGLDELDRPQGELLLDSDYRQPALIELGEPIIPRLIDTIENDDRLTREVEYDRHFHLEETIYPVRFYAMSVAESILRVHCLDSTEDNVYWQLLVDPAQVKLKLGQLKAYWKANAGLTLDERMMKVLKDPKSSDAACREAADNVVSWERGYRIGPLRIELRAETGQGPTAKAVIAKHKNPTAAEAILAVMDREMAPDHPRVNRGGYENYYLADIVNLRDRRIAPEFMNRYKAAKTLHMRLFWAVGANGCGDPQPIKDLAAEFESGKLVIPGEDLGDLVRVGQTGTTDLRDLIDCLTKIDLPESRRALKAAANPKHPFHDRVKARISAITPGGFVHDEPYLEHPFCLAFFHEQLKDNTPTGATYTLKGDRLDLSGPGFGIGSNVPDFLRDSATRRSSAKELACDRAAVMINDVVFGMPRVHPLLTDHDAQLATMRALMDRYADRFRGLTQSERQVVGWGAQFVADIKPLAKPATADDVKAGRALFDLAGRGTVATLKLPAAGSLKSAKAGEKGEPLLIVQAETDAGGKTHYGIIARYAMREAIGDEVTDVKSLTPAAP